MKFLKLTLSWRHFKLLVIICGSGFDWLESSWTVWSILLLSSRVDDWGLNCSFGQFSSRSISCSICISKGASKPNLELFRATSSKQSINTFSFLAKTRSSVSKSKHSWTRKHLHHEINFETLSRAWNVFGFAFIKYANSFAFEEPFSQSSNSLSPTFLAWFITLFACLLTNFEIITILKIE